MTRRARAGTFLVVGRVNRRTVQVRPASERRAFYHDGMRALQDRFDGRRVADGLAAHRRRYDFWDDDRVMIENAPFFFIATSFGNHTDCSMRSGMPG